VDDEGSSRRSRRARECDDVGAQRSIQTVRQNAANGLFSDGGATPLMDALMEVDDRFMRKVEDRWPVFVLVSGDGAESSAGANEKK